MSRKYRLKIESRADGSTEYVIQYLAVFLWWRWWTDHTTSAFDSTWRNSYQNLHKARNELKRLRGLELQKIITKVEYEEV